MRDFRNAKSMAKTLRESLAERSFQISHSESLELIAHTLGCKNWQTLSAAIEADAAQPAASPAAPPGAAGAALLPVVPMKDLVLFPEMTVPLYAGRPKTLRAIERAMTGDRRLFIITQRRRADEEPAQADLFEVGVIARILETHRLPDGSMKVLVRAERRARLVRLDGGELLQAEVEAVEVPPPDEASQALAKQTRERFIGLAHVDPAAPPMAVAGILHMIAHPGAFADLISPHVTTQIDQAQDLLSTADPAARLQRLMELMDERGREAA